MSVLKPTENSFRALSKVDAEDPVKLVKHHCAPKGATTPHTIAKYFGVDVKTIQYFFEKGQFSERRFTAQVAERMGLQGTTKKEFYLKTGWMVDNDHVAEELRNKHSSLGNSIKCLCAIAEKTRIEVSNKLEIKETTFNSWVNPKIINLPSRSDMMKMASTDGFGLTRDQATAFFEAAGYHYDQRHLLDTIKTKKLSSREIFGSLMEIESGSIKGYATKIGTKEPTVYSWLKNKMPRSRVLNLISGMSREEKQLIMACTGQFLDAKDVFDRLKDCSDQSLIVIAFKEIYDLTDDDFAVDDATLRKHRSDDSVPTARSMARLYTKLEKDHSELSEHWDTYKKICAKHLGHKEKTHGASLLFQDMDKLRNEYRGVGKIT